MSKIKNGGLDQYGAKPFEQRQFGTAGVEGVKGYIDNVFAPIDFQISIETSVIITSSE